MQLGYALVIAAKKCREVLRQIIFIDFGQGAHDTEIQRHVTTKGGRVGADLDIARVHVGMEEAIAKHLGKKQGHAIFGKLWDVDTGLAQSFGMADGNAIHALHDQDIGAAIFPNHLWDQDQVQALHIAAQLRSIGGFTNQVEFVMQVFIKLGDNFARLESLAII